MFQKIKEYIKYNTDRFLKDIGVRKKITVDLKDNEKKTPLTGFNGINSVSDSELRLRILEKKLKEIENSKK